MKLGRGIACRIDFVLATNRVQPKTCIGHSESMLGLCRIILTNSPSATSLPPLQQKMQWTMCHLMRELNISREMAPLMYWKSYRCFQWQVPGSFQDSAPFVPMCISYTMAMPFAGFPTESHCMSSRFGWECIPERSCQVSLVKDFLITLCLGVPCVWQAVWRAVVCLTISMSPKRHMSMYPCIHNS